MLQVRPTKFLRHVHSRTPGFRQVPWPLLQYSQGQENKSHSSPYQFGAQILQFGPSKFPSQLHPVSGACLHVPLPEHVTPSRHAGNTAESSVSPVLSKYALKEIPSLSRGMVGFPYASRTCILNVVVSPAVAKALPSPKMNADSAFIGPGKTCTGKGLPKISSLFNVTAKLYSPVFSAIQLKIKDPDDFWSSLVAI